MSKPRSPVLGYNHNLRYGGRVFHVQTEDSGQGYARLYTHLFFEGTILSSKKQEYDPESAEDSVRSAMQQLHKAMIRELTRGEHDLRIAAFFSARGEPAMLEPRPALAVVPAPAEPAPAAAAAPEAVAASAPPAVVPLPPPAISKTPGPKPMVTPKPIVTVQPTALKRSPVVVSNPADGVVVRRNVVIDVGAGKPPVQAPSSASTPPPMATRPRAGAHIATRDGAGFIAGNRARPVPGEQQPHQPLASTREIRMPWETPSPRRPAPPVASAPTTPAPAVPAVSVVTATGKIRMPWDPPGASTETLVSDKSLDEVILEYLADDPQDPPAQ
ncbi:MAG TPA: hypothetical protein VMT03_16340 [Polyangia bacterium]|nr:hypothetical protein [Polyangia bacterium]